MRSQSTSGDNPSLSRTTPRRSFLARAFASTAGFAGLVSTPSILHAIDPSHVTADDDWMAALTGKHRVVFDVAAHLNGKALAQSRNYLNAWEHDFHVPERDVNVVLGFHGEAMPIVLRDSLWSTYQLGAQYAVRDVATTNPAVRNVFQDANAISGGLVTAEQTVEALQKRGVRFLVCMNTIAGAAQKLAAAGLGAAETIRAALLGGLLPGVIAVPAMVVTLTQLQERGLAYTKVG